MLVRPTLSGADDLRRLVEDIGIERSLNLLGVSRRTLRRYFEPTARPSRATFEALFWHTRWGESMIDSEYGFETQILRQLVQLQRADQVEALARYSSSQAGNESAGLAVVRLRG
jgi:hypothetical protein